MPDTFALETLTTAGRKALVVDVLDRITGLTRLVSEARVAAIDALATLMTGNPGDFDLIRRTGRHTCPAAGSAARPDDAEGPEDDDQDERP